MSKTIHAAALAVGTALLFAGCGGQEHDAPPQAEQPHVQLSRAPANSAAGVIDPATTRRPAAATAAPGDEAISLQQQVSLLRREVAEIRQQLARMPSTLLNAETAPDPRTDPVARLEAAQVEQQRIAGTESAFRSEREDSRWSQDMVASVRAAVAEADEALRNQVRSVECRSRSCRVVIGGSDEPGGEALSSMRMRLAASLPNATTGQIDQGDGRPATVLYLSR